MEQQTKGKGVMMFAQRRQKIDEITVEQEEMRRKGLTMEEVGEPGLHEQCSSAQQDGQVKQHLMYQNYENQHLLQQLNSGMNGLDSCHDASSCKPLVSNRTAKPFLSGLNRSPRPFSSVRSVSSPTSSSKNIFKVPVPVNTSPQIWSPTGDVIASRDERIVVPAIKTLNLPEMKRRGANKYDYNEPSEEDCFGLGAEACNFMQAPTIRQKKPPPVLPKPTINPTCPPWSADGHSSHSPLLASSPLSARGPSASPQQNWSPHQSQPASKPWAPSPSSPRPMNYTSSRTPTQVPLSTPTSTPLLQSKLPWNKPQHDNTSIVSCPPQRHNSSYRVPKALPKGNTAEINGPVVMGKGAELFAKRQSRMEKFVVDDETVKSNKARSPSPTLSMPSTWKYSSNVRAPPPISYNPIVAPFYPPAAQKQFPLATSPRTKPKANQEKTKPVPKHLSAMDVMKHQPYQLDSSLFTYNSSADVNPQIPTSEALQAHSHGPSYLQAPSSSIFPSPTLTPSPVPSSASIQSLQHSGPARPSGPVSVQYPFTRQPPPCEAPSSAHGKPATQALHDSPSNTAYSCHSSPAAFTQTDASSSFFPLTSQMTCKSVLPIAPRPKFCAKKPAVVGKQWKRVVMQH